jgi:ABC-type Zn uptake system ZnuABC Zn-binding protein ZnuA
LRLFNLAFALLILPGAAGCRPAPDARSGALVFAVTISPLGAFLRPIVEGRAEVAVLLPPGASEHTYEVKPADARAAAGALALVYFDESLDAWASRLDARARLRLADLFAPDSLRHYAAGDGHGPLDPHVWLDPNAMRSALPPTVAALSRFDPAGAEIYRRNSEAFALQLARLDEELKQKLAPLRGRTVIQFHPSLFYFLERYGIRTAGVIETIAGQEPSPKQIKALADLVRAEKVEVIVTEPQLSDAPVRALAEATGVRIARMDPLGGVPGREAYAELLRYNANALLEAFP